MTRYGEAIERDFFDRGHILSELVAGRHIRLMLNLIDHLPRDSAFGEALATDEEVAQVAHESKSGSVATRPPIAEWSTQVDLLASIHDVLLDVVQVQMEKPYKAKPYPRPMTATERVRLAASAARRERIRQLFQPREA